MLVLFSMCILQLMCIDGILMEWEGKTKQPLTVLLSWFWGY